MKGGRLKIVNESRYPDGEVEELVRFGLADLDVKGKKLLAVVGDTRTREYRGWAARVGDAPDRLRKLARVHKAHYVVNLTIGPARLFPIRPYTRNGIRFDYRTWQEALVGIAAHEGLHVQHFYDRAYNSKSGRRRSSPWGRATRVRVGGERVEPKCNAHEAFTLRRYRERVAT